MKRAFHILLIAIIGLLAYSNTFKVPFQLDDVPLIVNDPIIYDFNFLNLYKTVKSRYIGYLTFALNYKLHQFDVRGYHIFNLTIHILNAILVYWLMALTLTIHDTRFTIHDKGNTPLVPPVLRGELKGGIVHHASWIVHHHLVALFSALLFVSHPVQTQAVTYIYQRFASLATFFYLLSLVMYIKFRMHDTKKMHDAGYTIHDKENPTAYIMDRESCIVSRVSWIMYLASFFSVVLAMKTKETAFTLPIIIALYEFSFFGKSKTRELPTANSRRFFYLLPFLFTLMVIPLDILGPEAGVYRQEGNYGEETRQLQLKEATTLSSYAYLLIQFRVIVTYIRLLLLPINQNLDYDYPVYNSFLNPTVFSSFLFLLSIFGLGIYLFYRSRVTMHDARYMIHDEQSTMHASRITHHALRFIAFGILWFFITLSVESSIIPIKDVIFEHRLYLPSIGFIIALSTALSLVLHRSKSATVRSATGRIRRGEQNDSTSKQNSSFSFLSAGLPLYGSVALIVLLSIATFQRNTVWQDKISLWEDTVKKSPGNPLVHFRLATAYLFKGQIDKAIEQHRITVKLWPDCALNYYFLGNAYEKKGLVNKAIEQYLIAVQLKPDFTDAHLRLQKAYIGNGLNR